MRKFLFLSIIFCCILYPVQAQTVVWQIQPSEYNDIVRLGSNLLMVSHNGKIGLINMDGSIVSPIINESITDYYEHKALLISNDGHGERVTGCLTDDGKYYGYTKKYYALNGQKFFSDDLLSVADENGALGYIDIAGNQVVVFGDKYNRIKPYSEGYAAVMKGKKYVLIDKSGNEVKFVYGGNGVGAVIGGCTNVYNGICYVYDEYGGSDRSFFLYNIKEKGTLKKTSRIKDTTMDYLFCYQAVSGRTKDVPYEQLASYNGQKGLEPTSFNGLYGYQVGEVVVLPVQLSKAEQFEDGAAIVELNGVKGILKYVDGESFSISYDQDKNFFYVGNTVTLSFNLTIPNVWKNKSITVVVKDKNGASQVLSNTGDKYSFAVKPSSSVRLDYMVSIYGDNLKLNESTLTYEMVKKERCLVCGKDKEVCEYRGNHPSPAGKKEVLEKVCETCGNPVSKCKYQGVH